MAVKEPLNKSPQSLKKLFDEARRLSRAGNHPHVLRMFAICTTKGYILTEYAMNGSAEEVLINQKRFMKRDELVYVLQVIYILNTLSIKLFTVQIVQINHSNLFKLQCITCVINCVLFPRAHAFV